MILFLEDVRVNSNRIYNEPKVHDALSGEVAVIFQRGLKIIEVVHIEMYPFNVSMPLFIFKGIINSLCAISMIFS